jgi:UDP-N-acetylglucosamine:LPS N-acetylglucosamine transferase
MDKKKNILILTSDAGFGHRSAANALQAAIIQKYGDQCQAVIVNPLDDPRTPAFLHDSEEDYTRLVRNAPDLYSFGYKASDAEIPSTIIESVLTLSLYEVMGELVREHQPNVIVTTYPMYQAPLVAYFGLNEVCVPLIVVVTDLATVHRIWFEPDVQMCLVPTETVKKLAIKNGVKEEKIRITGIPVSPHLADNTRSKEDIRAGLGWDPYLTTFLAVGSQRVDRLVDTLNVINHFGMPLQVAATAGRDQDLLDKLKAIEWHNPFHSYGYVDNMPDMMLAADAIISKAGGLVVTESLACGQPIMLIDAIPGQEEGNRDFVVEHGVGVYVEKPMQVLEALAHWMREDGRGLKAAAENARLIGRPNAAMEAAELIWDAASNGPASENPISDLRRTRLIDLLTRNQIKWEKKPKTGKT